MISIHSGFLSERKNRQKIPQDVGQLFPRSSFTHVLVTSKIPLLQKRLRSRKGWFILQRVFFPKKKMEWKAKRLSLGASDCVWCSAKSCIFLFLLFSAFCEDPPFEKSTFYEFWYTLSVCISLQTEASTVLHRWESHNKVLSWDSLDTSRPFLTSSKQHLSVVPGSETSIGVRESLHAFVHVNENCLDHVRMFRRV